MTDRDIIDVQLELIYGGKFPRKIQRLIDEELNQGRWVDGYDLSVCKGVIDGDDARKLLEIVLVQHPSLRINQNELGEAVEEQLPLSAVGSVSWIVDNSGSFALTDGLRVARFEAASIVWRSPRISLDGIGLDSLEDGTLRGRGWLGSSSLAPDAPFELDFETGELLNGQVVPRY